MNSSGINSFKAPSDPDPSIWLTPIRRELILRQLTHSRSLLQQAGLWRATLGYWVRWQASLEAHWTAQEEADCITRLMKKWQQQDLKSKNSEIKKLDNATLRKKLRVAPAVAQWSEEQWGHQVDSLYLKAKGELDKASCRLLRITNKAMANELYFRIKAKETSFEEASRVFGEGPEHHQGGLIPLRALKSMPFGLSPLLQQLEVGKISQPLRLGKGYCLVELIEFRPSQLDENTKKFLLGEQLRLWIDSVVDVMDSDLPWGEGQAIHEGT